MIRNFIHIILLSTIALFLGGEAVVAQQYVDKDSKHTFSVSDTPDYLYSWVLTHPTKGKIVFNSTGHISSAYIFSEIGTYILSVSATNTITNCIGETKEVEIIVDDAALIVNLGKDQDMCTGDDILLNVNVDSPLDYTYIWSDGSTDYTLLVNSGGIYSVEVFRNNVLLATDEVIINEHQIPIVDLGGDLEIEEGETLTLSSNSTFDSYLWSNGETTKSIDIDTAGEYRLSVYDGFCSNTDVISVVLVKNWLVDLGEDYTICEGEEFYLGYDINPKNSLVTNVNWVTVNSYEKVGAGIVITQAGEYCIQVSDEVGDFREDCMTLSVSETPFVDLGMDVVLEAGEGIILDAENSGMSFEWSTGEISQTIEVVTEGVYSVGVTNNFNCVGSDTIVVQENLEDVGPIWLPSGFSPNNDGKNDILKLKGEVSRIQGSIQLFLYNRIGKQIFQTNRPDIGWDGYYKGVLQDMDVYVFYLEFTVDGKTYKKRGNITLLY